MNYVALNPKVRSEALSPVLLIMHGYGADEHDLLPIASQLDPNFLAISIQAPIELSGGGFAWYHLEQTPEGLRGDHATRIESEKLLLESLPEIITKENGDPNKIFLVGFSQGAAMVFSLIGKYDLSKIGTIRGAIILSGYVPDDVREELLKKDLSQIPFFLSHGMYDDLIPIRAMENSRKIIEHTGAKIFSKEYECGHGLMEETVSDLCEWVNYITNGRDDDRTA